MNASALLFLAVTASAVELSPVATEICVYGGTPSGVMAAIAAARQGHSVALIDINAHTGVMVSGGLVATDMEPMGRLTYAALQVL